jgi:predicted RNA-binding Zn-ribbon protein involved in translation (DUF1610 family)
MELIASRHRTLACANCGRAAAEIALLPATVAGAALVSGAPAERTHTRDRLERTDFLGTLTKFGAAVALMELFDAIDRADFGPARSLDPDFVAFHCPDCGLVYCDTCWRLEPPVFEDGFYDCTRGVCPAGHTHVVDD